MIDQADNIVAEDAKSSAIRIFCKFCYALATLLLLGNTVAADKPNILIIVTDDQGYGDLSAYQHSASDINTPNMDRLAARGTLFTNAYATAGGLQPGPHPTQGTKEA